MAPADEERGSAQEREDLIGPEDRGSREDPIGPEDRGHPEDAIGPEDRERPQHGAGRADPLRWPSDPRDADPDWEPGRAARAAQRWQSSRGTAVAIAAGLLALVMGLSGSLGTVLLIAIDRGLGLVSTGDPVPWFASRALVVPIDELCAVAGMLAFVRGLRVRSQRAAARRALVQSGAVDPEQDAELPGWVPLLALAAVALCAVAWVTVGGLPLPSA